MSRKGVGKASSRPIAFANAVPSKEFQKIGSFSKLVKRYEADVDAYWEANSGIENTAERVELERSIEQCLTSLSAWTPRNQNELLAKARFFINFTMHNNDIWSVNKLALSTLVDQIDETRRPR